MRFSLLAMALLVGPAVAQQIPIPPFNFVYVGYSRGFQFAANTSFSIVGLALPNEASGAGTTASYLVRVNGVVVHWSRGNTFSTLAVCIPIAPGDDVQILGNWSPAAPANFTARNSYSIPAAAPFATTIQGVPHTLNATGWQWDIGDPGWVDTGVTGTSIGTVTAGPMGRVLVTTSPTVCTGVSATNTTHGTGCYSAYNSFYQSFADATVASPALSGNSLRLVPTANGYQGTWLPGSAAALYQAPTAGATTLALGDDSTTTYNLQSGAIPTPHGALTSVRVNANGVIGFGPTITFPGTTSYLPARHGFLNGASGGVYAWHDYNPAEPGSGSVKAEEPGAGNTLYITWENVESYSIPVVANPSTLQFQLDKVSGNLTIVFASIQSNATSNFGTAHVIGVTAPGPSADSGTITLATATAPQLLTTNPELLPLTIAPVNRPAQLAVPSGWSLNVSNIPATGTFGLEIFGLADLGITDLSSIGAPGCGARASLDLLNLWVVTGPTHTYGIAIPTTPVLNGVHLFTQAAVFVPGVNTLLGGTLTSNGMEALIGNL